MYDVPLHGIYPTPEHGDDIIKPTLTQRAHGKIPARLVGEEKEDTRVIILSVEVVAKQLID